MDFENIYVPIQNHSTKILTTTQKYEDEMKTMDENQQKTNIPMPKATMHCNGVDKLPKTAKEQYLWNQS